MKEETRLRQKGIKIRYSVDSKEKRKQFRTLHVDFYIGTRRSVRKGENPEEFITNKSIRESLERYKETTSKTKGKIGRMVSSHDGPCFAWA